MTQKHTELTRQDLRIYASQRLTDTPDGGGLMTKQVLTGKDNELFPPISDLDRTMGGFDARLVYPAVLRDDDSGLYGAHLIISEPPEADNVSILAVAGDFYGQERASVMERVESYRTPTTESRMTLLGTQRKGSRVVQTYQKQDAPLPVVGQSYALRLEKDGHFIYEFIRVDAFSHELRTFEDDKGEFVRRVIKIITQQALERDFEGVEDAHRFKVSPPARVMDTQIADSAKYYGVKPLAKPLLSGSASVQVSDLYEQLVPVSTVETALVDDWASGKTMWIETAPRRDVYTGSKWLDEGKLFLETGVLPASVQLDGWIDDGTGNLKNGERRLQIDYVAGVISGFDGVMISRISAIPAVQVRNYAYSATITVDETNVGTEWTPLLRPKPARGSVGVEFMVGNEWYQLGDVGDFVLRDGQGTARGQISKNGSSVISLPAPPDANTNLLLTWTPNDFYRNFGGTSAGEAITPTSLNTIFKLPERPKNHLKPNTIRLSWNDGAAQTASDQNGAMTGAVSGWVDYSAGQIYPRNLTAPSVKLQAEQYIGSLVRKVVSVQDGDVMTFSAGSVVQAGTLNISMPIGRRAKPEDPPVYAAPSQPKRPFALTS